MKPPTPPPPQTLPADQFVEIAKPIYGGAFLTRVEGKAVFVPLALPGEQARVRIVAEKGRRGYATAEVEEIVTAAAERVRPDCPHFGACGGCHYQHASYATQLAWKQAVLRETLERGGVTAPAEIAVLAGEPWGYRNRIRLAFDAEGQPGYRGRRSHAVIPISECPIAAPILLVAARAFAEALRQFSPALHATEIALFCNAEETALLATIFLASPIKFAGPMKARFEELMRGVHERVPALAGCRACGRGRPAPRPQPQRTVAQWGSDFPHLSRRGVRLPRGSRRIFPGKPLAYRCARRAGDGRRKRRGGVGSVCRCGLFSRKLTGSFARVVAVESAPAATPALEANLKGAAATPVCAAALDFLHRSGKGQRPDLIVVDPPRTGLGAEITTLLTAVAAPSLVYVSCDPATLARDLHALTTSGYAMQSMALADLFPQTFHLETVVHLRHS